MGHAVHFLERLDRLRGGDTELALALYTDAELLRAVLAAAAVPDGAERVAISLDHPREGPFVVVTRDGAFVTCLGRGMTPGDRFVITRDRLDVAAARVERMRERVDAARRLRDQGGETQAEIAFKRMQQRGLRFAREDAETLIRLQPLIAIDLTAALMGKTIAAEKLLEPVTRIRLDRMTPRDRDLVETLDRLVSGAANLIVVTGRPNLEVLPPELREDAEGVPWASATMLARWGGLTHVLRALWAIARSGKRGLDEIKAMRKEGTLPAERFYRELALGAIAAASPKLRAEARKALASKSHGDDLDQKIDELTAAWRPLIEGAIDDPDSVRHVHEMGAGFVAGMVAGGVEASPEEIARVPLALARAAFVSLPASVLTKSNTYLNFRIASALHWLARASPEELFLPVAWTEAIVPEPGTMDTIEVWLRPFLETHGARKREPTRREGPEVGRNDPCPCGSGKKFKRCHGAS